MPDLLKILKRYLSEPLLPDFLVQLTEDRISGLRIRGGEGKAKKYFIQFLKPGLIEPSAEKNNLRQPEELIRSIQLGMKQFGAESGDVSLLLPEACFRVFILPAEGLPATHREREALIRWRIKKLYPVLPDDFRFDYQVFSANSTLRLLVAGARAAIIEEYEKLLSQAKWRVRVVGIPTLQLASLLKEPNIFLINIERDYLTILAVAKKMPLLYRAKSFRREKERETVFSQQCLAEIENTLHFLEDKEKVQFKEVYLRWGVASEASELLIRSLEDSGLQVGRFGSLLLLNIEPGDREILAPLWGQIGS